MFPSEHSFSSQGATLASLGRCWVCLGALLCSVGRLEEEAERGRASLRTGRAKSGSCGPKESKPSFLTETPPPSARL